MGVSRGVFHWGVGLWCFGSCGLRGGVSVGQDCLGAAHGSLMGLWSRRFAGLGLSVVHCLWCGEAHCPAGCWSATVFRWVAFECQHSIREILLEHAEKQLEATLAANSHETVSSWVSPWVTQAPRFHEEEQTSTPEDVEFKKNQKNKILLYSSSVKLILIITMSLMCKDENHHRAISAWTANKGYPPKNPRSLLVLVKPHLRAQNWRKGLNSSYRLSENVKHLIFKLK